jgi:hypothetical protein
MRFVPLAVLLSLVSCNPAAGPGSINEQMAAHVPPDTVAIAGIRLDRVRSSPLFERVRASLPEDVRPFESKAHEVWMASNGEGSLVLIRGDLTQADFDSMAQRKLDDGEAVQLASGLWAIGSPLGITAARRKQGSPLAEHIPAEAGVFGVSNGELVGKVSGGPTADPPEAPGDPTGLMGNLPRLAANVDLAVFAVELTDGVQLDAHLDCISASSAEEIHALSRALIGMGRLSAPEGKPELLRIFDAIEVNQSAARVNIAAKWPPDLVEMLMSLTGQFRPSN